MAGGRRRQGRPYQQRARVERRRAVLEAELERAATPVERVAVAGDFLRGALKHAHPAAAAAVAGQVVAVLVELGTRLLIDPTGGQDR